MDDDWHNHGGAECMSKLYAQSTWIAAATVGTTTATTSRYVRQDQVDVRWRSKQFSFLLYQRQQGEALQMVALTLTGQQLFDVDYDGRRVIVKQRIDEMRLLPFEFLVRDILVATYPDFTKQSNATITVKPTATGQDVYIQNQKVLNLRHSSDTIDLDNIQVPYHMTFSSIENTLESN